MKKSDYNKMIIENFILFHTHESRGDAKGESKEMYESLDNYIEEDETDGIEGDEEGEIVIQ